MDNIIDFQVKFDTPLWRLPDGEGPASVPLLPLSPKRNV